MSATASSPTEAARQANAWASAYVAYGRSLAQTQALGSTTVIQKQIRSLQQQIDSLNAQIGFGGASNPAEATNVALRNALLGQQVSLQSQLQQAQQQAAASAQLPTVVTPAAVPSAPVGSSGAGRG